MTGQKVKKRGWVKDAAIIFLAIMLVLTFFSNTIMNHSLPEVAAQYVQSGSINAKIRGTGTVTANESFEVKSDQTREVLSVPVQVGDEVKVGDTLLLFSDAESSQIKEVQTALDALTLAYQKALIAATEGDYTTENRNIRLAQQALDKAKAKRDLTTPVSLSEIVSAKANSNRATADYNSQKILVENLTTQLAGMTAPDPSYPSKIASIQQKQSEINTAQNELASAKLIHQTAYSNMETHASAWMAKDSVTGKLSVYTEAVYKYFVEHASEVNIKLPYDGSLTILQADAKKMADAYKAIMDCNNKIANLNSQLNDLYATITYGDSNYNSVKTQLTEATKKLGTLETAKESFLTTLTELQTKQKEYDDADASVETCQKSLEEAMFALELKQKTDGKQKATESLDLAAQRKQIGDKNAELAKLKAGGEGASVESKVNGKVASISVSAGKTTTPDTALMVIEVPDMGYGVSFSVTTEQSKKVTVGDPAEITNYYSQGELTATLVGIKSDPKNPGTNKILNFKLQGEVESGSQLSISIGERGGSYDTIVPTSSIRSDNNGKFVLVVIAKNSPLGNRYIAQRIDVKAIASDDVNTAVSGALTTSDMVITTSTKPIEPGTQVRLADN